MTEHEHRYLATRIIPYRPNYNFLILTCRHCGATAMKVVNHEHDAAQKIDLNYRKGPRKRKRTRGRRNTNNTNNHERTA